MLGQLLRYQLPMYENMKAVSLKYWFCRKSLRKDETLTSWTLFWAYLSSLLGGFAVAHKIHTLRHFNELCKILSQCQVFTTCRILREWPWRRFLKKISIYQLPGRMSWPSRKKKYAVILWQNILIAFLSKLHNLQNEWKKIYFAFP